MGVILLSIAITEFSYYVVHIFFKVKVLNVDQCEKKSERRKRNEGGTKEFLELCSGGEPQ